MPGRTQTVSPAPRGGIDGRVVAAQLGAADVAVLATRVAAGLVTASLAPLVATTPAGALLMACVGFAFLLGTEGSEFRFHLGEKRRVVLLQRRTRDGFVGHRLSFHGGFVFGRSTGAF